MEMHGEMEMRKWEWNQGIGCSKIPQLQLYMEYYCHMGTIDRPT